MMDEKWLKALIMRDLTPKVEEKEELKTVKPKSNIQVVVKEFFEVLKESVFTGSITQDTLDKFYEDIVKQTYGGSSGDVYFCRFLWDLKKELPLTYYSYANINEALKKICELLEQEPEYLHTIYDFIEGKYPSLVLPPDQIEGDIEEFEGKGREFAREEAERLIGRAEKWRKRREEAKKTQIEEIASELDKVILIGREKWELMIYASLTPYAPPILLNGRRIRKNAHSLLIGEISSGKSSILEIMQKIAPSSVRITKTTTASFEGVATRTEIREGILDKAMDGVAIIPEFTFAQKFPLIREALDCGEITIWKGGKKKTLEVNTTFLTGANPKSDFFIPNQDFRKQIEFKEGVLSRFDILIPLLVSPKRNNTIIDKMTLFNGKKLPFNEYHQNLRDLAEGMKQIKRVTIRNKQEERLKNAFKQFNRERKGGLPLLTLRDFEVLIRLVNVITSTNFYDREKNGKILISDDDVERAIGLWSELINMKKEIYEQSDRLLTSISDRIIVEITKNNPITQGELKKILCEQENLCSKRTIERWINRLTKMGKIKKKGRKNAQLIPVLIPSKE